MQEFNEIHGICDRHMVVFQHGFVVLFNVDDHELEFICTISEVGKLIFISRSYPV